MSADFDFKSGQNEKLVFDLTIYRISAGILVAWAFSRLVAREPNYKKFLPKCVFSRQVRRNLKKKP